MRKSFSIQSVSVFLSLALALSSIPQHAFASLRTATDSKFVQRWTPPEALGSIVAVHESPRADAPVVLHIQDLHANYEVQKHIAELLDFYDRKFDGTPYHVAVEGAEGPVWIAQMAKVPGKDFRARVSDRLMQAAELTGTEYFAIVNGKPNILWGVENARYHRANLDLFRSTFHTKETLGRSLETLERRLLPVKRKHYSRAMWQLEKQAQAFQQGEMLLTDYLLALSNAARPLGLSFQAYPITAQWIEGIPENALGVDGFHAEQGPLIRDLLERQAGSELQRNLAVVSQDVELLKRFVREEVTSGEVRRQAPSMEKVLARVLATFQVADIPYDLTEVTQTLSASLDFYAMALLRDRHLVENTLKRMKSDRPRQRIAILVAGGFHTPGMTEELKEQGISYVVVAPKITQEVKSRDLYNQRLMGVHPTLAPLTPGRMLSDLLNGPMYVHAREYFQQMMRLEGIPAPDLSVPRGVPALSHVERVPPGEYGRLATAQAGRIEVGSLLFGLALSGTGLLFYVLLKLYWLPVLVVAGFGVVGLWLYGAYQSFNLRDAGRASDSAIEPPDRSVMRLNLGKMSGGMAIWNQLVQWHANQEKLTGYPITHFVVTPYSQSYVVGTPDPTLPSAIAFEPNAYGQQRFLQELLSYPVDQVFEIQRDSKVRVDYSKGNKVQLVYAVMRLIPITTPDLSVEQSVPSRLRELKMRAEGRLSTEAAMTLSGLSLWALAVILGSASAVPVTVSVLLTVSGTVIALFPVAGQLLKPLRELRQESEQQKRLAERLSESLKLPHVNWSWPRVSSAAGRAIAHHDIAEMELKRQRGKLALLIAA